MRTSELKGGGDVTVSPFHVPVAAERPALLVFLSHSVAAVRPSVLTMFPFVFSHARGHYALIGRFPVSRDR